MGVLACLSEKLKYILSLLMGGFPSFESLNEPESRKKDVIVNTLEPTETAKEGRRRRAGGKQRAGARCKRSEVWMKSGEKMERVDFRFPSGCCQVYK